MEFLSVKPQVGATILQTPGSSPTEDRATNTKKQIWSILCNATGSLRTARSGPWPQLQVTPKSKNEVKTQKQALH